MSKYMMIINNAVTATSRKTTATYFIRTEVAKNIPNINEMNEMNEMQLTRFADFVIRDGQLVKAHADVIELLTKALLS